MCGTADMLCFGLLSNADLITDMLDIQDSYNVTSCDVTFFGGYFEGLFVDLKISDK
jgi:hypothetical protein